MLALFTTLILGLNAYPAETLETHYLQSVAHAHSVLEVDRLKEAYERLVVARTACRIQKSEHSVPGACYEVLRLERDLGFPVLAGQIEKLDTLCASASLKLRLNSKIGPDVSTSCTAKVRAAQAIQAYREEDEWRAE